MIIDDEKGIPLGQSTMPCPYIEGNTFRSENRILPGYSERILESMFSHGYRHFGYYFFRPVCDGCGACVPIRVKIHEFHFSRNDLRIMRNCRRFSIRIRKNTSGSEDHFRLYMRHKIRFQPGWMGDDGPSETAESYEAFMDSFFSDSPCGYVIEMHDGPVLVAAAHIDAGTDLVSAVYTYWDPDHHKESLGRALILEQINLAKTRGIPFLHLGYYIEENRKMNYKARYRPNQILSSPDCWLDFIDNEGNRLPRGGKALSGTIQKKHCAPEQEVL